MIRQKLVIDNHEVMLDEEDYNNLPPRAVFFLDKDGYPCMRWISIDVRKVVSVSLHRWVMRNPPKLIVDHIDSNKLNSHKNNLRVCTSHQNSFNRKSPRIKGKSSIYKGVSFNRRSGLWQAGIKFKGKSKYLGQFNNESEAALAYNCEASSIFGEFAYLNTIYEPIAS